MRPNDRERFLGEIAKTRVSLPGQSLTDDEKTIRTEVFWEELKVFSIENVANAFKRARGELKFFPTPVEIKEFIQQECDSEYSRSRVDDPSIPKLEWLEPMEEGRKIAKILVDDLRERWRKEEEEAQEKRNKKFEENRVNLKKQAKIYEIEK